MNTLYWITRLGVINDFMRDLVIISFLYIDIKYSISYI